MDKYHDELTKTLDWKVSTLKVFMRALGRYNDLLLPHASLSNKTISEEIRKMNHLRVYIRGIISKSFGDFDIVACAMMGKTYGKLYDVLWKYHSWKKQLLEEKERITSIPEALEGDKEELKQINQILINPAWEKFTRHKCLVPDFYSTVSQPPPKTKDPVVQQYFNVETLNGILAGTNTGTIIQNNENKEVLNALKELTAILKEGHISDQYTTQALENVKDFQVELLSPYRNKSKLQKAAEGLQALANFSQLASFTIAVTPHLHTISQFVANLR